MESKRKKNIIISAPWCWHILHNPCTHKLIIEEELYFIQILFEQVGSHCFQIILVTIGDGEFKHTLDCLDEIIARAQETPWNSTIEAEALWLPSIPLYTSAEKKLHWAPLLYVVFATPDVSCQTLMAWENIRFLPLLLQSKRKLSCQH